MNRDDALVHLGNFLLEELRQHLDARPRKHDLGTLGVLVDVDDVRAQSVPRAIVLPRHLLSERKHRFGTPQVDDDRALLEAPDDPVDDLRRAVLVFLEHVVALGLTDQLDDHLLGRLGQDSPEPLGVELDPDLVADLGIRIELFRIRDEDLGHIVRERLDHLAKFEELDLSDFVVVSRFDLGIRAPVPSCRLLHRLFDGSDDFALGDALVLGDLLNLSF